MKKHLSQARFAAVTALGLALSLSATATYAGFQWVPPTGQEKAPVTGDHIPPAEAVPTGDVEQSVLPMPGEVVPAQPQLNAGDTAPQPQTLQLPPNYAVPPAPPAQEPVMKIKTITPSAPAPVAPPVQKQAAIPAPVPQEPVPLMAPPPAPVPAPIARQPLAMPPPAPAPVVTQTKVIMPEDAPQKAMDNTPHSEKLVINPYPAANGQPLPPAQPAPQAAPSAPGASVADLPASPPSSYAVVEGFGSDMPLAIALQQVVPAGYATSFDQSVNPGLIVSWDGGKPWDQVINDMIAPAKLEAAIEGKVVHIRQQGTGPRAEASPASQPEELIRRENIKDPGEESQIHAANAVAGIETAAGTPADETAPAAPEAGAAIDAAIEQAPKLPLPPSDQSAATGWDAKAGASMRDTLERWSEKAGVELIWMASYDYQLKSDVSLDSSFDEAVQTVTNGTDVQAKPAADGKGSIVVRDRTT